MVLKHSRILSSITDNQLSSRFVLDENYSPFDNNVCMKNDEAMTQEYIQQGYWQKNSMSTKRNRTQSHTYTRLRSVLLNQHG